MIRSSVRGLLGLTFLALGWLPGRPLVGQELPSGVSLLDRYVEVSGGKAAYDRLRTRVVKGTMTVAGLKGTVTRYQARPAKLYTEVVLEKVGPIEEGVSDGVAWSRDRTTGVRVKTGMDRAVALREAIFNGEAEWRKLYPKAETVGQEEVDGKSCYKVELTPAEGKPVTTYYLDKASGLPRKIALTVELGKRQVRVEVFPGDYRKVDGILIPHSTRQRVGKEEIVISISSIEHNTDIPGARFALPADVKKLAGQTDKSGTP
jgi:hypothetical protein